MRPKGAATTQFQAPEADLVKGLRKIGRFTWLAASAGLKATDGIAGLSSGLGMPRRQQLPVSDALILGKDRPVSGGIPVLNMRGAHQNRQKEAYITSDYNYIL